MKKIFIVLYSKNSDFQDYEIEAFLSLSLKKKIHIFIYSETHSTQNTSFKTRLEEKGIFLREYTNTKNLLKIIQKLQENHNITYIETLQESMIQDACYIRKHIGINISPQYSLFQDKSQQKELLQKYHTVYTSLSETFEETELIFKNISKKFKLPFVIKPHIGIESSGVCLIYEEKNLLEYIKLNTGEGKYIVEEYIDGNMYSIDYFVDEYQNIYASPPIQYYSAQDLGINDFFIYSRAAIRDNPFDFSMEEVEEFLLGSVTACRIKNTFIHHEFKYTKEKELKTIEINGRIGGKRLKILNESYGIRIYDLLFEKEHYIHNLPINNFSVFTLYPSKTGVLISYNTDLLNTIKNLLSFHSLKVFPERYIGKKIGLTKEGYWNVGVIYLKHKEKQIFLNDYNYIKNIYKDLLIIK